MAKKLQIFGNLNERVSALENTVKNLITVVAVVDDMEYPIANASAPVETDDGSSYEIELNQ